MSLEDGKISSSQLTFLAVSYTLGASLVIPPGIAVNQDAWIAIIFGLFEGLLINSVYIYLSIRFPGKTFIEINNILYGSYLGKFMSFLLLLFFFHIASLMVIDFSNFFNGLFLTSTPILVLVITITLITASAVRNGIEVIARCNQVIIPIVFFTIIVMGILLLKDIHPENYFPVLETPIKKLVWISHRTAIFPFTSLLLSMIIPYVNKQKEAPKSIIKGTIISALLLLFIAIINIGVLGSTAGIYTYPNFQVVRLINYGQIITRLEILFASIFLASGFLQYSLVFYGIALGTAQLTRIKTYLPVVLPIGVLLTFQLHYYNIVETIEYQDVYPIIAPIFVLIIPLLTLIVALFRDLP